MKTLEEIANEFYFNTRQHKNFSQQALAAKNKADGLSPEIKRRVDAGESTGNKISDFIFRYHNGNQLIEKVLRDIQDKMILADEKDRVAVIISLSEIIVAELENDFIIFEGSNAKIPAKRYCCSIDSSCIFEKAPVFSATELTEIIVGDEEIENWLNIHPLHHKIIKNLLQKLRE